MDGEGGVQRAVPAASWYPKRGHATALLSLQHLQEVPRGDDSHFAALLQTQQVAVTRDQVVCFSLYCAVQYKVVRGILLDQLVVLLGRHPFGKRGQLCNRVVDN